MLLLISGCNSNADRFSLLKQCTVLGDESILYARAHYVRLFYHFNPVKFSDSYEKIKSFDTVTHRNVIDTYSRAVDKINNNNKNVDDIVTQSLLSTCINLSKFSTDFVEENYRLAINHHSKNDPLTDDFFNEINQIVKFDDDIGAYDKSQKSFKQNVDSYQEAVENYIKHYRKYIPTAFLSEREAK